MFVRIKYTRQFIARKASTHRTKLSGLEREYSAGTNREYLTKIQMRPSAQGGVTAKDAFTIQTKCPCAS
jgi:hypothetical protein